MKVTYEFETDKPSLDGEPVDIPHGSSRLNHVFQFMVGDVQFTVGPRPDTDEFEIPAQTLRASGNVISSGLTPVAGGRGPHEDYQFMEDSTEYTYTSREVLVGSPLGGVIEKIMPAGAKAGKVGQLILYKGISTVDELAAGEWTERLIRPFIITDADITDKDSNWPATGDVPTVEVTKKIIEEGATPGDGFNHI